jgi:hypothetical protein
MMSSVFGHKTLTETNHEHWYVSLTINLAIYDFGFSFEVSGIKHIILVFYMDDILLTANDTKLFLETKHMLSSHFSMKDLGKVSYILGIRIICDRSNGVLESSQKT